MKLEKREKQYLSVWINQPIKLSAISALSGGGVGLSVIAVKALSNNGFLTVFAFAILLLGLFWLFGKSGLNYFHRFLAGLGSFMLASLIVYFFIAVFLNPFHLTIPIWGHLWRIGAMLITGIVINGLIAYTQSRYENKSSV